MSENNDTKEFVKVFMDALQNPSIQATAKEMTANITVQPYIVKIKQLESNINFLAKRCAEMTTKPHEQNSEYWLELANKG